jgi:hypothetical protein
MIERGKDTIIRLSLYRSGVAVVPSSLTVTVLDPSQTAVVNAVTVTPASTSTYTVLAAITATAGLGEGWAVRWSATVDGQVFVYDRPAAVVRRVVYPVISDLDIRAEWRYLDPTRADAITVTATWQAEIDAAWIEIQHRLIAAGRRPELVLTPSHLRMAHLRLVGAKIHHYLAGRGAAHLADTATYLERQYEAAWAGISFQYDADDDGVSDDKRRTSAGGSVWLGGARNRRWHEP